MTSYICIQISPVNISDPDDVLRNAITCSSTLPPPGFSQSESNEAVELKHLSKTLGWKNPQGLYGYSVDSEYKDLYVYFDHGDKSSPVNEVATKAFSMYGLGGAMVTSPPTWGPIRGNVIIIRNEPDYNFSPWIKFEPLIRLDEMFQTMVFFRDSKKSAYSHAMKRDSVRNMKGMGMSMPMGMNMGFGPNVNVSYLGPTGGFRSYDQVLQDKDQCENCGKTQAVNGSRLKQCQRCNKALYCGRDCQKAAWKAHKKVCKSN